MRVGAIIQARFNSTRLPGKVLMELPFASGTTILEHIVKRIQLSTVVDEIVIATSNYADDDAIFEEARRLQTKTFRGSKDNVLERFIKAGEQYELDIIIRITGDNPIIFTELLDSGIKNHINGEFDYTYCEGLPVGTNYEIVNLNTLKKILSGETSNDDKEHVTFYIKSNPDRFSINRTKHSIPDNVKDLRFTVDYPSDYAFMNVLFNYLERETINYSLTDIYQFLSHNKWIIDINKDNFQKKLYATYEQELKDVVPLLDYYGYKHIKNILIKT